MSRQGRRLADRECVCIAADRRPPVAGMAKEVTDLDLFGGGAGEDDFFGSMSDSSQPSSATSAAAAAAIAIGGLLGCLLIASCPSSNSTVDTLSSLSITRLGALSPGGSFTYKTS